MRKIVLLIFLFINGILFSQSQAQKIDSLLQVAETANDSVRLRIFNKVGFYFIFNDPPRAKQLLQNAIAEAKNKKVPFSEAELVNTYGIYYDVSGQADSANYYFKEALALSRHKDFKTITVMVINNLGMFHWNKGNYQDALDYFFQALKMNETNTSEAGNAVFFNNIGLIYQEMGQYDKAIEYHNSSLELRRKYNKTSEIPASLNNIGINLVALEKFDEAEKVLKEAVATAEAANEQGKYFDSLSSLADLYITQEKPAMAIPLFTEILKGRDAANIDRRANLIPISFLIQANNSLGNTNEALKYVVLGNEFLEEFPDLKNAAVDFYQHASETYFRTGNPQLGGAFLQKSLNAKERIFSDKSAAAIADLETKYNLAQKEKDLAQ
ncbi:tetratricopeptide repeat protein, partial [Altibacter sp.]|uniref:tetratricopeptide repeat protein n=1 Tax=Altibacter sp. TaxID=2024823 RepID=UPI0025891147